VQARPGEHGQLGLVGRRIAAAPRQEAAGLQEYLVHRLGPDAAKQADRMLGRVAPALLGGQAGARPDVVAAELARLVELVDELGAAMVGFSLREPEFTRALDHVFAALMAQQQGVTLQLAVVGAVFKSAHPWQLNGKRAHVLVLAAFQDPFAAQPVFDSRARPADVESVKLCLPGLAHAQAQLPVVGPHGQGMARRSEPVTQRDQRRPVTPLERHTRHHHRVGGECGRRREARAPLCLGGMRCQGNRQAGEKADRSNAWQDECEP
jgi:hypothetical protein